jgi:hypothetical protein
MTAKAKLNRAGVSSVSAEFASADLGDKRRNERLSQLVDDFAAAPDRSLPAMSRDAAALEGAYRIINNKAVQSSVLIDSHAAMTAVRVREQETVLVLHDGTVLLYPLEEELREGFGRLGNQQGIQAVVSLAVSFAEDPEITDYEPLGVLACQTWAGHRQRTKKTKKKKLPKRAAKRRGTSWGRISGDEWFASIARAQEVVGPGKKLIHVIDREADGIELFARLGDNELSAFVIRVMKKRRVNLDEDVAGEFEAISEAAARLPKLFEETVAISKRKQKSQNATNPSRAARTAGLEYRAGQVRIKKSWELTGDDSVPTFLTLNLVHVKEVGAPNGEEPIEWFLLTSEPISTAADVARVVRIYRARWLIEEFFRVLKTGCAIEKRQVESRHALETILAISLVVAWRIMLLRERSRHEPPAPATVAFTKAELDYLHASGRLSKKHSTVCDALLAVAALGGHIKNNGPPGNVVLARGMERLLDLAAGWETGQRCDR